MLVSFDFAMLQLRYLEAAADKIPTFRPDGLDAAGFKSLITSARDEARTPYLNAKTDFDLARGEYREAADLGHDTVIGVYAAMKSRYRKDPGSLSAINALPVDDQTADGTIKRMQQTSALWGKLP